MFPLLKMRKMTQLDMLFLSALNGFKFQVP